MDRERRISIRVPESEHRPVRVKAADLGISVSDVVRELLARWVAGELKTDAEVKAGEQPK